MPKAIKSGTRRTRTHIFPGGRFQSMLRAGGFAPRVSKKCGDYIAATISYLTHELLELAVKAKGKNGVLTPRHLNLAIRADDELGTLLQDVVLTRGGVVAGVNPALERKSSKKGSKKASAGKSSAKKTTKKATAKKTAAPSLASLKKQSSVIGGVTVGGAGDLNRQESNQLEQRARDALTTHKWQYKADNGTFQDYDKNASIAVEIAYQSWLMDSTIDVRSVQSGDWEYMVDFNTMKQQNIKHHAHKVRDIQRVPLPGRR